MTTIRITTPPMPTASQVQFTIGSSSVAAAATLGSTKRYVSMLL